VESEGYLSLLVSAGSYLWGRGQYRQALTLEEQAAAGRQQALGHDHPDTLTSMNDLAEVHRLLGAL
jgi:hypothetical protein